MNIILLSGGSGKRLWPLSNDIRSKQFVRMLSDGKGDFESMLTRVHRQITAVDSQAEITIATGKKQVSLIKNQLGDKVHVCVEPCRRDTFPAICLAASYLKDVRGKARRRQWWYVPWIPMWRAPISRRWRRCPGWLGQGMRTCT